MRSRLKKATYNGEVAASYTYDAAGNRTRVGVGPPYSPNPTNNPPVAQNDNGGTVWGDSAIDIYPLGNDSDPDGDTLTITEVSNIQCSGSAQPNGDYITFYAPNNTGQCSFTYTISDGRGGTASAEIVVGIYVWY